MAKDPDKETPPPADTQDDLDDLVRRTAERTADLERLSAKINDLHGQIEAYRRKRNDRP